MSLDELFSAVLLDHHRHPRHYGELADPDLEMEGANPLCGDEIILQVKVSGGKVDDVAFTGRACAICTASTSMFCERAVGTEFSLLDRLHELLQRMLRGGEPTPDERRELQDMASLQGVSKLPVRVKCATLVWETWELMKRKLQEHSSD